MSYWSLVTPFVLLVGCLPDPITGDVPLPQNGRGNGVPISSELILEMYSKTEITYRNLPEAINLSPTAANEGKDGGDLNRKFGKYPFEFECEDEDIRKSAIGKIEISLTESGSDSKSFSSEEAFAVVCFGRISMRYFGIRSDRKYQIGVHHLHSTTGKVEKTGTGFFRSPVENQNHPVFYRLTY